VTKFSLAINTRSKQQEETMYVDIVAWDKLAETCNTYLKKGMSVLVDGRLSIRSYETKDGEKRKSTEVVCNTMQMLDSRGGARPSDDGGSYERSSAPPRSNGASSSSSAGFDEDAALEDEIPF
jgi:single-strand DNA-binding protein